ncbi:hypothetical protein BWQ96_02227 [Gracilariopsis chorda]|uniref:Uncharacterized protein n=1 Tax=Gracilariopsis chorda TaxID=448386 RepID=A0A2V3J0V0_9FLOR|nr:hypothetical protein BWQ96_02227 [Gracilariopsis chorda]|eukprot:PXF48036.1 hypothetical protein BWQ96_02227 [Gracilariopsis chorda]
MCDRLHEGFAARPKLRPETMFAKTPVLRLKRKRSEHVVDTVQVRLPPKRRRTAQTDASQHAEAVDHLVFRRVHLQQQAHRILQRQDTRIIDLDCAPLSQPQHALQPQSQPLCNDQPMVRFELPSPSYPLEQQLSQHDRMRQTQTYDVFILDSEQNARPQTDQHQDETLMYIDAQQIDLFESDGDTSSTHTSDQDARSIDYPSTPQHSDQSPSQTSSYASSPALGEHGSHCTLHCPCGLGMRDATFYAYDIHQHEYHNDYDAYSQ